MNTPTVQELEIANKRLLDKPESDYKKYELSKVVKCLEKRRRKISRKQLAALKAQA